MNKYICDNKNCKNIQNNVKNDTHSNQNTYNNAVFCKNVKSEELDVMRAYAKTFLIIYPTLPNIVSIVDGIVEKRAASSISLSSIYAGTSHTYKQIEKVIDLSERKYKLLNIFSLIKEIIAPLSLIDYEIVDLKFFRRKKTADISEILEMDERAIYRKINKILDGIVKFMHMNLIDIETIENLIRGEGWIKEIYKKSYMDLSANKLRGIRNKK